MYLIYYKQHEFGENNFINIDLKNLPMLGFVPKPRSTSGTSFSLRTMSQSRCILLCGCVFKSQLAHIVF